MHMLHMHMHMHMHIHCMALALKVAFVLVLGRTVVQSDSPKKRMTEATTANAAKNSETEGAGVVSPVFAS
jgi:hypothetical protein